jgi:hypothetical protein
MKAVITAGLISVIYVRHCFARGGKSRRVFAFSAERVGLVGWAEELTTRVGASDIFKSRKKGGRNPEKLSQKNLNQSRRTNAFFELKIFI